ncbi:MAG: PorV/PorQ family protein [Bacteroidota bacterium]
MNYGPRIFLLVLTLLPFMLWAQVDGRASAGKAQGNLSFLSIDLAPQNAALGTSGVVNPAGGFLQNPALLSHRKDKFSARLSYSDWMPQVGIVGLHYAAGDLSLRLNEKHAIGLSYQHYISNLTQWFFEPVAPFDQFSPRLYYAQSGQSVAWGMSLGYVEAGHDNDGILEKSRGLSLSAGFTYYLNLGGRDWLLAASISDYGPKQLQRAVVPNLGERYNYLPTTLRLGASTSFSLRRAKLNLFTQLEQLLLPQDLRAINSGLAAPFLSIHQNNWGQNWQKWQLKLGLEWAEIALGKRLNLNLRTGYWYEHPTQGSRHLITAGWGLKTRSFSFDTSYWTTLNSRTSIYHTLIFGLGLYLNPT